MSWMFSKALIDSLTNLPSLPVQAVDSTLPKSEDTESSAPLSVMPTPHKFWRNDKTMEFSRLSQFGLTCALLTQDHGEELLTSFLAASPARISARQEMAQAYQEPEADCGLNFTGSFAIFDQHELKWKTVQCSLLGDLIEFSETWPQSGMMLAGVACQRETMVPPHERNRIWIAAYPYGMRELQSGWGKPDQWQWTAYDSHAKDVADSDSSQREGKRFTIGVFEEYPDACAASVGQGVDFNAYHNTWPHNGMLGRKWRTENHEGVPQSRNWGFNWPAEPDILRVVNGVAFGRDRLKALGNGQVPRVAQAAFHQLGNDS